jgi:hypothetical protein
MFPANFALMKALEIKVEAEWGLELPSRVHLPLAARLAVLACWSRLNPNRGSDQRDDLRSG